ncbi:hypothetical protein SAMN04488096_105193 [Mesonia phycicola]|uniref:Aspartate kinase n=1 Tax=Mesonia phycicola TaxID=579105 RepID=A0A1M6EPU7_9FLAO|nr:hypothetical protein [Mesonia phycicola]SHI87378.1 hypothetical protein SAMN04488096_105193 [Mesonia phycicola]
MKTVAQSVEQILKAQPFLEEALQRSIINYSALAEELQPEIASILKKPVKTGAIMMALRRYQSPVGVSNNFKIKNAFKNLGDITVRSNISAFTFKNTTTLVNCHGELLSYVSENTHLFYAFTRGILESNIMISGSEATKVKTFFKEETLIVQREGLAAISVQLPQDNFKVAGLYYQIFKHLAWQNIALYEVVSTTNEFTVLVEEELVEQAFAAIKNLKV